ncbi:formate/nitrite transporter family protein [Aurantimonas sp. C2-6-R+9]|uniref:formate/nitrite transporter family protein n=2 Tax=Aurantimonas TaxID=182269 RepID=UPI002E16E293|nr:MULTISPECIES: formate/nitrite transporter family protein [unclassified Aurantimonas]MEC5290367.1 formate/nitrite transporter family protein [Aurantimonas sp. C2-3-R2]MEC5379801.1 formate/nitrite transporter family protein [Aurantimonas sp. C2-6-R+9]MEC5411377.1 formate/nitrite transporter family protein [Aurantimonas sp. C2-4-R8]
MQDQKTDTRSTFSGVGDRSPEETAANAVVYLSGKVKKPAIDVAVLSILAGFYIAFGSIFYLVTGAGNDGLFGLSRLFSGVAFSVGLVLVVVAGAELFTGDTMLVIQRVRHTLDRATMWRFWGMVYAGNFVGSLIIAILFVVAGGYMIGDGAVGLNALKVASGKTGDTFYANFAAGILANMLVCLAIWLALAARTVQGKILAIVGPISTFVAAGFEHSIANMSIIPIGLMTKWFAGEQFWTTTASTPDAFAGLTVGWFLWNLLFVTIGNMIGGGLIGLSYWHAYLRGE